MHDYVSVCALRNYVFNVLEYLGALNNETHGAGVHTRLQTIH